jgi:hypothetical protein
MKTWRWISFMLIIAVMIASCNAGETSNADPGTGNFPAVTQIVEDGVTPMPTSGEGGPGGEIITGNQSPEGVPPVAMPEGQVIDASVMLSSLFVLDVAGQTGKVADIEGVVLEPVNGQMQYIAVSTHGPVPDREMLLPWGTFYIISFPAEVETEAMQPAPMVWLRVADESLANAPEFDRTELQDPGRLSTDWDTSARSYWAEIAPPMPVTGEMGAETSVAPLLVEVGFTGRFEYPALDPDGDSLGVIEDIILDQQGRALFVMLRPATGSEWIPVAWKAFAWVPEEQAFMLQVPASTLAEAPRINRETYPDTTLPGWESDWQQYWQENSAGTTPARTPSPESGTYSVAPILFSELQQRPVMHSGRQTGTLVDWVMDANGQSQYAVIEAGETVTLYPWDFLDWQLEEGQTEMIQDQSQVKDAPSYTSLDQMNESGNWQQAAAAYWTEDSVKEQTSGQNNLMPLVRAGQMLDDKVVSANGNIQGEVLDLLINPDGQVTYVLVSIQERLILVPWINFEYNHNNEKLVYLDDIERFEEAPGFTSLDQFDPAKPDWDRQIRSYWGLE